MSTTTGRVPHRAGPVAGLVARGRPPGWLRDGLCAAWGWEPGRTRLRLIAADLHASFLILVDGQPVAVTRISVPPYMEDTAVAESEVAWMTDLDAAGVVHVPAVITPCDGRDVALLADDDDRHWVCLTTTWAGDHSLRDEVDRATDPLAALALLGSTAARMHEHALGFHRPRDFVRPTWDTVDLVGPDARWGNWRRDGVDPVLLRAEQQALDVLRHASRAPDSWGLVHGDLRPEKVMLWPDGVAVIDFENCGFSWFMFDLAAALSGLAASGSATDLAQAWATGYQRVRPLTGGDIEVACALVVMRQLQLLGRGAAVGDGAVLVAERYLRTPDWLLR